MWVPLARRLPDRRLVMLDMPGTGRSAPLRLGGRPPAPWVTGLLATPARYYSRTYLRVVAPLVVGRDPAESDAAWRTMNRVSWTDPLRSSSNPHQ